MSTMKSSAKKNNNIADKIKEQEDLQYIVAFGDGVWKNKKHYLSINLMY